MIDLDFVLTHRLPKATRAFLATLLRIGQAQGMDLVLSDLDMPNPDNVASADLVLTTLENAGLIACGTHKVQHVYPFQHTWVPKDRTRIKAILETP